MATCLALESALSRRRRFRVRRAAVTLRTKRELAICYARLGRVHEAVQIQTEVVRVRRERIHRDRYDGVILRDIETLGRLHSSAGSHGDSLGLWREVVQRRAGAPGALAKNDNHLLTAKMRVANELVALQSFAEAEAILRDVIDESRRRGKEARNEALLATGNLAAVLRLEGRLEDAMTTAQEAVDLGFREFGEGSRELANARDQLVAVLWERELIPEAAKVQELVVSSRRAQYGDDDRRVLRDDRQLAKLYLWLGRSGDAARVLSKVLTKLERTSERDDPEILETRDLLDQARTRMKDEDQ